MARRLDSCCASENEKTQAMPSRRYRSDIKGKEDQTSEMRKRIMGGERATCCEALDVIGNCVNITGPDDQKEAIQMGGITFGQ